MKSKVAQSQTLQNHVYEYLHDQIVSGNIPPGQRIVEEKISQETGVSRSPIREAIRRLNSDGLVSVSPRGGVRVYRASFSDFKYLYECRLSLEPTAAYYAALRMNDKQRDCLSNVVDEMNLMVEKKDLEKLKSISSQFHSLIVEASENPYLVKMMNQLNSLISFYRNAVLNIPLRIEEGAIEHQAIWQAIQTQDGKAAEELMRVHIQRDYQFYTSMYSSAKEDKY
ncbi:GntR family transcriptional regulator [Domibacillus sp. DTU_2020_1001157_1_SI_ALB_TIR_016]|uniref:GntR family transcriptional regulator n=1 Tax=Domibacillus sp. DTU_2020_1001157_1_SI_ALB_TIR_016 TaxID=3077789 RepID=UPI0028EBA9F1|nr:GntR family transcriptional regulator [Domibacillus sp. DTU_2020_1001157_1_SI_ALB_TIR_016]WNS78562.1 GntR family transcriptional regulator [Domibacillus sp. DTU_2020_1001157_1_SI_ALB_TIR_016]